jgi:hypothetical protein
MRGHLSHTLVFLALTASTALASPIQATRSRTGELQLFYQGPKRVVVVHHSAFPAPRASPWSPPVFPQAPVFHNGSNVIVPQHSGSGISTSFSGVNFSMPTFSSPTFSPPTFSAPTWSPPTFSPPTFSMPVFSSPTFAAPTFSPPTFSVPNFSSGAPSI